jgi:Flp pilus assembly protein TadG
MNCLSSIAADRARRGVAAVEFALLLPLLCLIFIGTVDFCRVYYYSLTVSNCARNGALYGSADSVHALDSSGIRTAAQADAGNLDLQQLSVSSSTDSNATYAAVTVTYPFNTITKYPGIPNQITLKRSVRMNVLPQTPTFN